MGASPDGLVSCFCCGKGICEVRVSIYYKHFNAGMLACVYILDNSFHMQCPHCQCNESVSEAVENPKFCLEEMGGSYQLKKSHAYYYQVLACMYNYSICSIRNEFLELSNNWAMGGMQLKDREMQVYSFKKYS